MSMQVIDLIPDLKPTILAARQVQDARNTLAQYLPYRTTQSVSYRLGRRSRVDQTVPVRALDAPAVPIRRPGVVDVRGDLPAITPIVDLSEQDLTQEMIIAQQLAGIEVDWTGPVNSAAATGAATIDNTFELMRGQLLSTGKISLAAADGSVHEVDFEVPSAQKIEVTDKWTLTDGDPFADLEAAHEAFIQGAGSPAAVMVTSRRTYRLMLARLQKMFPNQPVGMGQLGGYLSDQNLPQVVTNDRTFRNPDGTKTRVFDEGTVTFLPEEPVGSTELGVTQEAVQQVQGRTLVAAEAPGLTVVTLGNDNPVQRSVKVAAIGMPVLRDNDAITILHGVFA